MQLQHSSSSNGALPLRSASLSHSSAPLTYYMLYVFDAWDRFELLSFWWLHLMVAALVLFAVMVYVVEPLFLRRVFRELALRDKNWVFTIAIRLHAVALAVSAIAIGAGVLGAHGGL